MMKGKKKRVRERAGDRKRRSRGSEDAKLAKLK